MMHRHWVQADAWQAVSQAMLNSGYLCVPSVACLVHPGVKMDNAACSGNFLLIIHRTFDSKLKINISKILKVRVFHYCYCCF